MLIINHRVNSTQELVKIPSIHGVEIDVRAYKKEIILNHEAFENGERLNDFLKNFNHEFIIINIKEFGFENEILNILKNYRIENYCFLDLSYSGIHEFVKMGNKNFAVRLSNYESIENVLKLKSKAGWVWVDCFDDIYKEIENLKIARDNDFRVCIASPDLLGRPAQIEEYKKLFFQNDFIPDAVCVKKEYYLNWKL
ncbi:MAG: hypothetical protein WHW07_05555 [Bacteroidales bacterium]|jgi:hypothetical protein|nr:hypothetical protein [Bacteroidales bacterium]HOL98058.1 hypothetical protein [Bacteroidales bacterium]HOM37107.1 hypothetical protein [Bacteroidales bacterium]HPD23644.1 hypothetical protein [Bacteroidales bacterium]HRS99665.1 hypothetical protein [Bacteroidales bacterium]